MVGTETKWKAILGGSKKLDNLVVLLLLMLLCPFLTIFHSVQDLS